MATAADADLVLKLYDLRREPRMRTARDWVMHQFHPRTLDDLLAVQRDFGSEHNQYWRQVIGYWEMAAALVLHGTLDRDLFFDSNGENIFLLAKFGRFNEEYSRQYPGGFMPQTATLVASHPAAQERCDRLREYLEVHNRRT
jgi:hypothetical protein